MPHFSEICICVECYGFYCGVCSFASILLLVLSVFIGLSLHPFFLIQPVTSPHSVLFDLTQMTHDGISTNQQPHVTHVTFAIAK